MAEQRALDERVPAGATDTAADGNRLVSGGWDTTILVWDMQGLPRSRGTKPAPLSPKQRKALWAELGSADAARAYRAVRTLIRAGEQSASFLADRLQPIPAADAQEITRLIADLDSERFTVRTKAEGELEKLAELAEPALRRALEGKPPSLEFRRRIESLLERLQGPIASEEQLRLLRAVEILEHVGTPGVQPLRRLAAGAPGAWLTREASAALGRRNRRAVDTPPGSR